MTKPKTTKNYSCVFVCVREKTPLCKNRAGRPYREENTAVFERIEQFLKMKLHNKGNFLIINILNHSAYAPFGKDDTSENVKLIISEIPIEKKTFKNIDSNAFAGPYWKGYRVIDEETAREALGVDSNEQLWHENLWEISVILKRLEKTKEYFKQTQPALAA